MTIFGMNEEQIAQVIRERGEMALMLCALIERLGGEVVILAPELMHQGRVLTRRSEAYGSIRLIVE